MTAKSTAKTAKPKASAKSKSATKPKAAAAAKSKPATKSAAKAAPKKATKSATKAKAAPAKAKAAPKKAATKAAPAKTAAAPKKTVAKAAAPKAGKKAVPATKAAAAKAPAKAAAAKPSAKATNAAPEKAPAKATKAAAKAPPKPAAKATAPAKAAAASAKTATKKPVTKAAAPAGAELMDTVRPLIRVRQAREFTGKRVTKAELDAITEVARWSGSSRNEQPCRFIAMRDQELISRIADIGLPQTRGLRSATAAVAIVEPDEPERADSRAFDDGRAAERMLVAAHMLGLGGGISRVRPDVRAGINKAVRLPANRSVRTIVALGHPTEDALAPQSAPGKARLPREEVIYEECWPDPPLKD